MVKTASSGREPLVREAGPGTTYVLDQDDVSHFSSATRR
jgi:hypothetical protein